MKKWKLIKEEDVSPSKWFPLFKHTVELPNGKVVDDYYIAKLGDVGMIVAVTPEKEILFVNQYKHAAEEVIYELPAGRLGSHSPEEGARRELEEETGYMAQEFVPLGFVHVEPSKNTARTFCFLALDAKQDSKQNLDDNEDIEVVKIPAIEINQKILDGEIRAADTIAFLHIAQIKHPEIFV